MPEPAPPPARAAALRRRPGQPGAAVLPGRPAPRGGHQLRRDPGRHADPERGRPRGVDGPLASDDAPSDAAPGRQGSRRAPARHRHPRRPAQAAPPARADLACTTTSPAPAASRPPRCSPSRPSRRAPRSPSGSTCDEGTPVLELVRLRSADGEPIAKMTNYLPERARHLRRGRPRRPRALRADPAARASPCTRPPRPSAPAPPPPPRPGCSTSPGARPWSPPSG